MLCYTRLDAHVRPRRHADTYGACISMHHSRAWAHEHDTHTRTRHTHTNTTHTHEHTRTRHTHEHEHDTRTRTRHTGCRGCLLQELLRRSGQERGWFSQPFPVTTDVILLSCLLLWPTLCLVGGHLSSERSVI